MQGQKMNVIKKWSKKESQPMSISTNPLIFIWSGREDSNLRPPAPKAGALNQAALRPDYNFISQYKG